MSKELTPLQALEKIVNDHYIDNEDKEINIIETALKDYERLKTSCLEKILNEESKEYIYKKLKALEIIKLKQVNIFTFYKCCGWNNPSHYNDSSGCPVNFELTQEEYDLLKEVLL